MKNEERKKSYFASDMHLGSTLFEDPLQMERRLVRWLDQIKTDAKALYLLGDVFDYWFEYRYVVPRGFTRFLGKIAEMTDLGIEIHFFIGNHDIWLSDYLSKETGMIIHKGPYVTYIEGKKIFMAHGDGLGDDSRSFKIIRRIFHSRICRVLFATIHPRWTVGFAHAWSRHSRKKGMTTPATYLGEEKEHLVLFSKQYVEQHPDTDFLLFGHRHILLDLVLSRKNRILILGDWISYFSYAVFDGESFLLEQFED